MRSALLALLWANLASCYSFNGLGAALRRPTAALASPALGQARMIASLEADVLASDEEALAEPGFNDTWYAVSFSHELSSDKPFATRLWGEPLVLYRDGQGEAVCVRDVCPHRSAPLSMGEMQDGKLRCFYHGWAFGKQGACEDVPTVVRIGRDDGRDKSSLGKTFCATSYSVVEHDGMLWVWRGNMLAADARKLPPVHESSFVVDTTLDHDCDWSALVARGLDAPHLALHESSAIPSPTPAGEGTSKTTAHDGPVIVRHGDIFGGLLGTFSEEVHVVPIAQRRSRVLLRQRFPKTPLLSMLLQLPGAIALFTLVVQNWNYRLAIDGADGLRKAQAGMGGERAARFRDWVERVQQRDGAPYFGRWGKPLADQFGQQNVDEKFGTYGLKTNYVRDTPLAQYAPMQASEYRRVLDKAKALEQLWFAALATSPAGILMYKTVAPAVAASLKFGGHA